MPTVQFIQANFEWYVQVVLPHRGEVARFGPFSEAERDAFMDGAEAFASPFCVNFDKRT